MKKKRESTTPRGYEFKVLTLDGFLDWHQQNVRDLDRDFEGSVLQAACWFAAYDTAEQMVEVNSLKDWAHTVLAGLSPLNCRTALADWLDEWERLYEDESPGNGHVTQKMKQDAMIVNLRKFWLD